MLYIIQVVIYTGAMLLIYMVLLRNRPLYQLSRHYLLASAVLPLLMPFLQLPQFAQQRIQTIGALQFNLPVTVVNATADKLAHTVNIPALWLIYGLVTTLFIAFYLLNIVKLLRIISKSDKKECGAYSLITSSGYGPGSFGKYIFFPGTEVNNIILAHEQAHIKLRHSRDIIFLSILQAIMWPNFLLVWIKKEIKEVHEFQADSLTEADRQDYARLLLSSVFNTPSVPIMHLFIIHPIKRRIMMLQKNGKASPLKTTLQVCGALLLFLGIAAGIQSCAKKTESAASGVITPSDKSVSPEKHKLLMQLDSMDKENILNPAGTRDAKGIYRAAEKMPTGDYQEFLANNLVYPESAKKKGIEGKVIVRFVVDENGNVKDPEVVKSPDASLSEEALRVVRKMPAWTPGEIGGKKVPVYFALPIAFRLH